MKLNKIWGYGQLFGYSAIEGKNRYQDDHILMTMKEDLCFRYEFKEHYIRLNFITGKSKVTYETIMSDFVIAKINQERFILTFADNDTLVGQTSILPTFVGEISLKEIHTKGCTILNLDNHYLSYIYQKRGNGYRFVIHHSLSLSEAKKDYKRYLKINLDSLIKHYQDYYQKMPKCKDKKYETLYYKCLSVNKVNTHTKEGNIKRFWTTPNRVPHRHMWLWDSGFHALMMSRFNMKLAEESLLAMLEQIKPNGLLPHMVSPKNKSNITQPCVLSWIGYELYKKSHHKDFLKKIVNYLDKYLTYDLKNRDFHHNGLLSWKTNPDKPNCKCDESGLDNCARFDFDEEMDCVDFSSYLAMDANYLSKIYHALGNKKKEKYWANISKRTTKLINSLMYDKRDHTFYDRLISGKLTKVLDPTSFLPLCFSLVSQKRADEMVKVLFNKKLLYTPFPFASISQKDPRFSNDMWRGGTWLHLNYMIIRGLKQYGYIKLAKQVRDLNLKMVNKWFLKYGCIFEFFDSLDKVSPFKCARKGKPLKEPDYRKKMHAITDFHWSAVFTYLLIQNDY